MSEEPKTTSIDLWKWLIQGGILMLLWAAAASLWQGGWTMEWAFWALYFKVGLVLLIVVGARTALAKGPTEFAATVVVGATVVWMIFADSFAHWGNFLIDLAAAVLASLATLLIMRWWTRRLDPAATSWKSVAPKRLENADAVVWGLLAWVFVSLLSVVVARPLPVDEARFAGLGPERAIVSASADRFKDLRVGLALSGGGFRAAIFHAGVLEALEDLGIRVNNLSTVSGGSIIGAYYAVGGEPKAFAEAVAEGRFDLKRELMMIQNALRLPFPMRLPGVGAELLPFGSFDRLDVQSALLQRRLFDHARLGAGLVGNEPRLGQPELMIAVTDLTYGFQIGLLPDGILKLGHGVGSWKVYRGTAFEPSRTLTLAERVAISGAFPVAFPPTPLEVRVRPFDATGQGVRRLLLVDGGARDNTGSDLLRAADRLSEAAPDPSIEDYVMPASWDLDAMLVSDASAIAGVLEAPGGSLNLLSRVVDVASIEAEKLRLPEDRCEQLIRRPPTFSPSHKMLSPDTQFNLKNDASPRAELDRVWQLSFDPARYPEPVLRRVVAQLPDAVQPEARSDLDAFLEQRARHEAHGKDWSLGLRAAARNPACRSATWDPTQAIPGPPGVCAAARLKLAVETSLTADLEVFRSTSTLDDRLPRRTVTALERLGRMLVYLRSSYLEHYLEDARQCSGSAVDGVGERLVGAPG